MPQNESIVEMLTKLQAQQASRGNKNARFTYRRAIRSVRLYPLPIESTEDARSLDGVGSYIASKIGHFVTNRDGGGTGGATGTGVGSRVGAGTQASQSGAIGNNARDQDGAHKQSMQAQPVRMYGMSDAAAGSWSQSLPTIRQRKEMCDSSSDAQCDTHPVVQRIYRRQMECDAIVASAPAIETAKYYPSFRKGPWYALMALWLARADPRGPGATRDTAMDALAAALGDGSVSRGVWSSGIRTLASRGLVIQASGAGPGALWTLTETGVAVAAHLAAARSARSLSLHQARDGGDIERYRDCQREAGGSEASASSSNAGTSGRPPARSATVLALLVSDSDDEDEDNNDEDAELGVFDVDGAHATAVDAKDLTHGPTEHECEEITPNDEDLVMLVSDPDQDAEYESEVDGASGAYAIAPSPPTAPVNVLRVAPAQCSPLSLDGDTWNAVLLLDAREVFSRRDRSEMHSRLLQANIPCEKVQLPLGDMLWVARRKRLGHEVDFVTNFIVERKTMADLALSIIDGRYEEQKMRLEQSGLRRRIYLVEGKFSSQDTLGKPALQTAMHRTQAEGYLLQHCKTVDKSLAFIAALHEQIAFDVEQHVAEVCVDEDGDNGDICA